MDREQRGRGLVSFAPLVHPGLEVGVVDLLPQFFLQQRRPKKLRLQVLVEVRLGLPQELAHLPLPICLPPLQVLLLVLELVYALIHPVLQGLVLAFQRVLQLLLLLLVHDCREGLLLPELGGDFQLPVQLALKILLRLLQQLLLLLGKGLDLDVGGLLRPLQRLLEVHCLHPVLACQRGLLLVEDLQRVPLLLGAPLPLVLDLRVQLLDPHFELLDLRVEVLDQGVRH